MNHLLESPITILVGGAGLTVISSLMAVATGRRWLAWTALGMLLLSMGLTVLERFIVTPREQMYQTLYTIARDLESNDVERITPHISLTEPDLVRHAQRLLPQYTIHQAKVKNNLVVEFTPTRDSNRAIARFNAVFRISETRGSIKNLLSPWYFIVEFVREEGAWRAVRYERRDPRDGLR